MQAHDHYKAGRQAHLQVRLAVQSMAYSNIQSCGSPLSLPNSGKCVMEHDPNPVITETHSAVSNACTDSSTLLLAEQRSDRLCMVVAS